MQRLATWLILPIVTLWFTGRVLYPAGAQLTHGFAAYYTAAKLVQNHQFSAAVYQPQFFRPLVEAASRRQVSDIYNANPPTTALMFWPLSFFTIQQARIIWTALNALMLWAGLLLLVFTFARPPQPAGVAWLLSLGMLFQPAIENIRLGQAYLLMFLLLTAALAAWQRRYDAAGGAALALALLLKTSGWPLLPMLAWQQRRRYIGWAGGIVAGVVTLTLTIFPLAAWQAYLALLLQTTAAPQVCATAYQTTRSLLCRLFIFNDFWSPAPVVNLPWLAHGLFWLLAAATLAAAFVINRRNPLPALLYLLAWGVIFAPLGEQYHHTLVLVPLGWLVIKWDNLPFTTRIFSAVAMAGYLIPLRIGGPGFEPGWWALLAYPRLYSGWLVLLALFSLAGAVKGKAPQI